MPVLLRTCRECQQVSGGVGQQFGRSRGALDELVHDPGVYHSVVDWSETPRPHRSRETQFVVFNGSPGAAALSGLARPAAARGDHTTAQELQARAATVAARDGAPPHTLQTAATTT